MTRAGAGHFVGVQGFVGQFSSFYFSSELLVRHLSSHAPKTG